MGYKLYEYHSDDLKIGLIISDKEQLLYLGATLYSARTNKTLDKKVLNSDITGRGLVQVSLDPLAVTIAGTEAQPVYTYEAADKTSILQHWQSRIH